MANNSHHKDAIDRACTMKEELMERIERLGDKLPPNTLDQLIDELGGPENVAEVSILYIFQLNFMHIMLMYTFNFSYLCPDSVYIISIIFLIVYFVVYLMFNETF